MRARRRVAVVHPCMGQGGSETVAMWLLQALQGDYDVALITGCRPDLAALNQASGTAVDPRRLRLLTPALAPLLASDARGAALRGAYVGRFIRGAVAGFDLPVCAYNLGDFGRPGIHFIADFSWDEALRLDLDGEALGAAAGAVGGMGWRRRLYLGLVRRLAGGPGPGLLAGSGTIVANSRWTADQLEAHFGVCAPVVYPPVPEMDQVRDAPPRGQDFVCLGRISAEKRIEQIIGIIEAVRGHGHEVGLRVVGPLEGSGAARRVRQAISSRPWVRLEGYRVGAEKERILRQCRYGIHARSGEAFGIAVAEMVKAGCLTFAPDRGGVAEILAHSDLTFASHDEAVAKILAVMASPGRQEVLLTHLARQGERFTARAFTVAAAGLVAAGLDGRWGLAPRAVAPSSTIRDRG